MIGIKSSHKNLPTTQVLFDGDSMTALNGGMVLADTWPQKLKTMIDAVAFFDFYNSAVGGQTIAQMLANVATEIDARKSGTYIRHVAVLWGGINDLYQNANSGGDSLPETVYIRWSNWINGRKSAGFLTIATTLTATQNPLYPSLHTEIERGRQLVNQWIREASGLYDVLIDLDADTRIGGYAAVLDNTYFQSDQIHMNDAGRQVVANLFREKILFIPLSDGGSDPYENLVDQDVTGYEVFDDNDTMLTLSPVRASWTEITLGGSYGGKWIYSNAASCYYRATLSTVTRIKLRIWRTSLMGQIDIYFDGVLVEQLNAYHPYTLPSEIYWDSGELAPATRLVEFRKSTADTSTYNGLDALFFKTNKIENNDVGWVDVGTWNNAQSSTTFYRYSGIGSTCTSVGGTKTIDLPLGTNRVKLFAPKFASGGTIKMQIIRLSDSAVVYDQNFSQSGANTRSGGSDGATAQLDTGVIAVVPYQIVLTAVTATIAFDAIEYET